MTDARSALPRNPAESSSWPLGMFVAGTVATCGLLLLHPARFPFYYPWGDLGSTFWNYWWFDFACVGQGRNPLRCDWLFYPIGCGLTHHTMGLFYCAVFWPVRTLAGASVAGPALAYNLQVVMTYLLTMGFTYGLARQLGASRFGAALAGVGAGLGRYRYNFAFQMTILSTQWIPLYFWMLVRVLGLGGRKRDALWLGVAVVCLLTTEWHYLFFCALATPLFLAAAYAGDRGLFRRVRLWRDAGIAALAVAPVLSFYLWNGAIDRRQFPVDLVRGDEARVLCSASLADYALAPRLEAAVTGTRLYPLCLGQEGDHIQRMFYLPGYLLAALALWGAGRRAGPACRQEQAPFSGFGPRFWVALASGAMILSLGPVLHLIIVSNPPFKAVDAGLPLPYSLLQRLPVFGHIEQLCRFGYVATLGLSVAGGLSAEAALEALGQIKARWGSVSPILARGAVALAVLGENYAGCYNTADTIPSQYAAYLRDQEGDFAVLVLPDYDAYFIGRYMLDQATHQKRLMEGYIGRHNLRFDAFAETYEPIRRLRAAIAGDFAPVTASERENLLRQAAERNLRYVVIFLPLDCSKYHTYETRDWLIAQGLATVAYEDAAYIVLALNRPRVSD